MVKNFLASNCLSFIKLLAALQVVYGHVVEHMEFQSSDWIGKVIIYYNGVPIFFVISGFLIWFSMQRSSSYGSYLKKRFLRIYPELWVAVIIEIVTIVILYNGWNIKHLIIFLVTQGTILQFWTPESLRGYGCGTPNGTLWTICVMAQFYIIAWPMRKFLHNRKMNLWIVCVACLTGISMVGEIILKDIGIEIVMKLYDQTIVRYCWLFCIGCFIAEFKDRVIPVLMRIWYLFLLTGIVPYLTSVDLCAKYAVFWSMFLVSGLIGFAYRYPHLEIKPDISYGIFLYHMIIVNVFITFGWIRNWWYAVAIFVITICLATFSTKTIGKWSEKKKQIIIKANDFKSKC